MVRILEKPAALSFSGNLTKFLVESDQPFTFSLKKKSAASSIFEHTYYPGTDKRSRIDVSNIIEDYLYFTLQANENVHLQPNIKGVFVATIDSQTVEFEVIRGGISNLADTTTNWLKHNFLTWQPIEKNVTYHSPEWICWYSVSACALMLDATFEDQSRKSIKITDCQPGNVYTANLQYGYIAGLLGKLPSYYDVYLLYTDSQKSQVQRYLASDPKNEDEIYVGWENSLGGYDVARMSGYSTYENEGKHEIGANGDLLEEYNTELSKKHVCNTGLMTLNERFWFVDFFISKRRHVYIDYAMREIVLSEDKGSIDTAETIDGLSFTFREKEDSKYLNVPRLRELPSDITIPVPSLPDFNLPPRLVEYARITLDEGVLIPAQHPTSQTCGVTTWGAMSTIINKWITDAIAGIKFPDIPDIPETLPPGPHTHQINDVVQLKTELEKRLLKETFDALFRYDQTLDCLFVTKPLAVQGGVTMYADADTLDFPSIYDGIPLGDGLIWKDGKIVVTVGGGLDEAALGSYLTTHKYATQTWVTSQLSSLHSHSNKSVLDAITTGKVSGWDSAYSHISDTTKHITAGERVNWNTAFGWGNHAAAGYALNSALSSHVSDAIKHITTAERNTWNAKEPALGTPSINGYLLSSTTAGVRSWVKPYELTKDEVVRVLKDADGCIRLDAHMLLSGGLTMLSSLGIDVPSIFDNAPIATPTSKGMLDNSILGTGLSWVSGKLTATATAGTFDHASLNNRNAANQHTIAAITGLQAALDAKSPTHSHPYRPDTWIPTAAQVGAAPTVHGHDILFATDNRTIKPNTTNTATNKLIRPFFTRLDTFNISNLGTYGDCLVLDTYPDGSGGYINALIMPKGSDKPRLVLARGGWNADSWLDHTEVWTKANFDPATKLGKTEKAADSDKLDGYNSTSLIRYTGVKASDYSYIDFVGLTITNASASGASHSFDGDLAGSTFEGCMMHIGRPDRAGGTSFSLAVPTSSNHGLYYSSYYNNQASRRSWTRVYDKRNANLSTIDWNCNNLIARLSGEFGKSGNYYSRITNNAHWIMNADDTVRCGYTFDASTNEPRWNKEGVTQVIWNGHNSNLSTVDWSAKNLTLNGAIRGCLSIVSNTTNGYFIGNAANGLGGSNTGGLFYAYGNNPLHFYTSGVSRMHIRGDGFIGVGTISPSEKLHIVGNLRIDKTVRDTLIHGNQQNLGSAFCMTDATRGVGAGVLVGMDADGSGIFWHRGNIHLRFGTNGLDRMRITNDGLIGIGLTTGISARLHVNGLSGHWTQVIKQPSTVGGSSYGLLIDAGASAGDSALRIRNASTIELFHVRGDGNIGVGVVNPAYKLTIGDSDSGFHWHSDGLLSAYANGVQLFNWNSQRVYFNNLIESASSARFAGEVVAGSTGNGAVFFRPATNGFTWGSGNGALTVDIRNNGNQTPLLLARREGFSTRLFAIEQLNGGSLTRIYTGANNNNIVLSSNGRVSINRLAEAQATLHVGGNILADGGITMLSDMRLKKRIETAKSVLPHISAIDVFRYTLKADTAKRIYIGVSAQQIQSIWSEFVHGNEMLSLDYAQMAAYVAIKGLQETKLWMDSKDKKIAELEKRIVELEKNVA